MDVCVDVCDVLGIKNSRDTVARLPKDNLAQTEVIDSMGRQQQNKHSEKYIVANCDGIVIGF